MSIIQHNTSTDDWKNGRSLFDFEKEIDKNFSCIIPCASNWYHSTILSCSNGYCIYGGRYNIVIINLKVKPPVVELQLKVCNDHAGRVTSLTFMHGSASPSSIPKQFAIACDNGLTRIYNTMEKTVHKEHNKHKVAVSSLSWSSSNTSPLLAAGDGKGNISIWYYIKDNVEIWQPIYVPISSLQLSPSSESRVLVGYSDGKILIGDVRAKLTINLIKGHNNEITSLSWNPFLTRGDFVSSSKDQDLKVWEISKIQPLSTYHQKTKSRKSHVGKKSVFTAILWLNQSEILFGQQSGEIFCWNPETGRCYGINHRHTRLVYSICKDELTNQFVTSSLDRSCIVWDAHLLKPRHEIPGFGGFVYSLSASNMDPNCIAIGSGDNTFKIWSFGNMENVYSFSSYTQKQQNTKVLVVLYHSTLEGICGYGLSNGEVGYYNTLTKKSERSSSSHKLAVYSLCWGPSVGKDATKTDCLYSVGSEGNILAHKLGNFKEKAINFSELLKSACQSTTNELILDRSSSEIAWRNDYKYVATGYKDGVIDIVCGNSLKCLLKITLHKKSINCLAWHHSIDNFKNGTDYSCWLASCADENSIFVTDITIQLSRVDQNNMSELVTACYRKLVGHSGRVYRVIWNPHKIGELASCSQDGTIQIWCVKSNEGLANFRGHDGRVQTVIWSLTDPDVLYSGGEDYTLRRWRITPLLEKLPPADTHVKSKKNKIKENEQISLKDQVKNETTTENPSSLPKQNDDITKKKKKQRSILPNSSVLDSKKKELMQEDCLLLAIYLNAENEKADSGFAATGIQPGSIENANLGLYATTNDALKLLQTECNGHKEKNYSDLLCNLNVWRYNIGGMIENAIKTKTMNEMLISLSPIGGHEMWLSSMLAYARQLEENRSIHQAALYYVALGDALKAVNMFKESQMYKEAILLAKLHLLKDDPLLSELYHLWTEKLVIDMNYEKTAECFLSIGCIDEAVSIVAKRGDSSALSTAVKLAQIYNREDLKSKYFDRCMEALIQDRKWNVCNEFLAGIHKLKIYHLQSVVGEILEKCLVNTNILAEMPETQHHIGQNIDSDSMLIQIVTMLRHKFDINDLVVNELIIMTCTADEYSAINKNSTSSQVFNVIADQIVLSVIYLLKGSCDKSFKSCLLSLNILHNMGYVSAMKKLVTSILPKQYRSFEYLIDDFSENCKGFDYISCYNNFNAFYVVSLVYEFWWNMGKHQTETLITRHEITTSKNVSENLNESLYMFLVYAVSQLLSPLHLEFELLQISIESTKKLVQELKLQTRLKEHVRCSEEKQIKSNQTKQGGGDESKIDEIMTKKAALLKQRDSVPYYVQEFCYPTVKTTVLPILYICMRHRKQDSRYEQLVKYIKGWLENYHINVDEDSVYLHKLHSL